MRHSPNLGVDKTEINFAPGRKTSKDSPPDFGGFFFLEAAFFFS